ncbi:two component transcriptional regulator of winged helix family [alpha proteobacterium U9-1i]|nr:two component transcriptional regulator of winged helix family [alpha proteobacterium U9-1i]
MSGASEFTIAFGAFTLDTVHNTVRSDAGEIQMSPLAARLLAELARTPGKTVERSVLVAALWRDDPVLGDSALNRLVSETRQMLGDDPKKPQLIQTVPRRGYRLVARQANAPLAERTARVLDRTSYTKLAIIAGLIVLTTVAIKILLDTLTGVLWVANN